MTLLIYAGNPNNKNACKALVAAEYRGVTIEMAKDYQLGVSYKKPEYLKMNPIGKPKYQQTSRIDIGASARKVTHFISPSRVVGLQRIAKHNKYGPCMLLATGDNVSIETSDTGSGNAEVSLSDDQSPSNLLSLDSTEGSGQSLSSAEPQLESQIPEDSSGSVVKSSANLKSTSIRSSRLTAREKLRAARVLSRKIEPKKPAKLQLGSQVLANLRESDKGKRRPGLPEAPTNLLDDSKRGMPKKGLTFELPGGREVFFIIFSVVFISTVMFTTTYIVWKVGAIHFNE